MAHLFLENISASEEDIQEFLARYGFPRFDTMQHFPGNGLRPAVLLSYRGRSSHALRELLPRIHHLFWKRRRINAFVPTERFI
jgi:hypothetical protein